MHQSNEDNNILSTERPKYGIIDLCELAESYGITDIKHYDLFEAYAYGCTRKELSKMFLISEQQVKGRIEYAKKLIRKELRRIKARDKLREMDNRGHK